MPHPVLTTPRSKNLSSTLASLNVANAGSFMDKIELKRWHVTCIVFMMAWFVLFSLFITFYPTSFMGDSDFLSAIGNAAADGSDQKGSSDNVLSDNGRALVWGTSLGFGALVAFVYNFFTVQVL
jgi:hypothetical protein